MSNMSNGNGVFLGGGKGGNGMLYDTTTITFGSPLLFNNNSNTIPSTPSTPSTHSSTTTPSSSSSSNSTNNGVGNPFNLSPFLVN